MGIQWFPGHMTSAKKKAEETLEHSDMVIEVLDARIPAASHNPMIEQMRNFRQRPCLKILNKADLADPAATQAWLNYLNAQPNTQAVALSCKKPGDAKKIPALCKKLVPHRGSVLKPLRAMIMGIPNVGKSTLMNALLNRRIAKVGDEPAVTKSQQRFEIDSTMTITDTPGMMWPKIAYESDGYRLAVCHAIGRNAVIEEEVAQFLAQFLLNTYPSLLDTRYKVAAKNKQIAQMDAIDFLTHLAELRAYKREGMLDFERTAMALLTDFRGGALGRISLETPQSRAHMINSESINVPIPNQSTDSNNNENEA